MWKKLALRGTTRSKSGVEELCYFKGGFGKLSERLASDIRQLGGSILLGVAAKSVDVDKHNIKFIETA